MSSPCEEDERFRLKSSWSFSLTTQDRAQVELWWRNHYAVRWKSTTSARRFQQRALQLSWGNPIFCQCSPNQLRKLTRKTLTFILKRSSWTSWEKLWMSWQWAISSSLFHRTEFAWYFIVSWLSCHVSLFIIHRTGSNPPTTAWDGSHKHTHTRYSGRIMMNFILETLNCSATWWGITRTPEQTSLFSSFMELWHVYMTFESLYPLTKACLSCLPFPKLSSRLVRFHFFSLCLLPKTWSDDDVCMLSFLVYNTREIWRWGAENVRAALLWWWRR